MPAASNAALTIFPLQGAATRTVGIEKITSRAGTGIDSEPDWLGSAVADRRRQKKRMVAARRCEEGLLFMKKNNERELCMC